MIFDEITPRPLLAAAALFAAGVSFAAPAHAVTELGFDELTIVGDSLSDTGLFERINTSRGATLVPPPYNPAVGRFSSGLIWADQLQLQYPELRIRNPALGGAFVNTYPLSPTLTVDSVADLLAREDIPLLTGIEAQVANLGPIGADERTVFWAGANDVVYIGVPQALGAADAGGDVNAVVSGFVDAVVGGIVRSLLDVIALGAQAENLYVANLPDIGLTPIALGAGPQAAALYSSVSMQLNNGLAAALATAPGLQGVQSIDIAAAFDALLADPGAIGVTETMRPCVDESTTPPTICTDPETRIFWDFLHPSSTVHGVIRDVVVAAVEQPLDPIDMPAPTPAMLVLVGVAGLGGARRLTRRR